jgi:4-amino-4-deoxy-L-arabinose transferase-like glycosyltransferase
MRCMRVRWTSLAALAPAVVLLVLLCLQLPADPASGVTSSNSPFTDEGWNVMASRNWVLLGDWSAGNWALHLIQLPFTILEAATFTLLGVGIVQARLAALLCTVGAVALIGTVVRRRVGTAAGVTAAAGLASSGLLLYYGRLVYLEDLVLLALAVGTALLFWRAAPAGRLRAVLGGLALVIAIGTKALALIPVAGLLLGAALAARRRRPTELLLVGGVILAAGLAWLVLIALPNAREIGWAMQILAAEHPPASVAEMLMRIGSYVAANDGALALSLPLMIGGIGGIVAVARGWSRLDQAQRELAAAAIGWLVAGLGLVLVASYRPSRYVLPILPPLAILSGYLVHASRDLLQRVGSRPLRIAVVAVVMTGFVGPGLVSYTGWAATATTTGPAIQAAAAAAMDTTPIEGGLAGFIAMRVPAPIYIRWSTSSVNSGDLYAEDGVRWVVVTGAYRPAWADAHSAAWDARRQLFCVSWGRGQHCLVSVP